MAGHTASTAFESWPEFGEMLGARYDGHPWNTVAGTVINEDPAFPATKHFPPVFNMTDEFYQAQSYSRAEYPCALAARHVEDARKSGRAQNGR